MNYFFEFLAQLPSNVTIIGLGLAVLGAIVYIISLFKKESISKLLKEVNSGEQERVAKALAGVPNMDTFLEKASNKDKVAYVNKILDNQQKKFELLLKTTRTIVIILILLLVGIVISEQFVNSKDSTEQKTEKIEQQEVPGVNVPEEVKPKPVPPKIPPKKEESKIPPKEEFFIVKIAVNSDFIDAHVFVDGKPAVIIEAAGLHKEIKIKKKDTNSVFMLVTGSDTCTINQTITENNQNINCSNI